MALEPHLVPSCVLFALPSIQKSSYHLPTFRNWEHSHKNPASLVLLKRRTRQWCACVSARCELVGSESHSCPVPTTPHCLGWAALCNFCYLTYLVGLLILQRVVYWFTCCNGIRHSCKMWGHDCETDSIGAGSQSDSGSFGWFGCDPPCPAVFWCTWWLLSALT